MLVIEGSDCLGKTTVAKKIVNKMMEKGYPTIYSHMGRPNEQLFDFFLDYKKMINPCAVQDRFHLGGLAYHHDKITPQKLQIINSWIRSVGGMIVVLYAADETWYKQRLENDKRRNLLPIVKLLDGNLVFQKYAKNEDCDYIFNISPTIGSRISNCYVNYVNDYDIDKIIAEWIQRRELFGI